TNDSKVILRWEIDNANSLTPGVYESAVLIERGFEWKASIRPNSEDGREIDFLLICSNKKTSWNCKAQVEYRLLTPNNSRKHMKDFALFDDNNSTHSFDKNWNWASMNNPNNV
ncbi:hypothetical protein PMAYCL1PPCAC_25537, partial [Pristionchus mayeri]